MYHCICIYRDDVYIGKFNFLPTNANNSSGPCLGFH